MRIRLLILLLGAALVVITWTVPLWQPILQQQAAEQAANLFPGLSADQQSLFAILPREQQDAYRALAEADSAIAARMVAAALSPGVPAPESGEQMPPLTNPIVAATGVFQRIDAVRWAQGDATIYEGSDGGRVLRFENFSMANAPDMRVFLSISTSPVTPNDLRLQDQEVDLGALQGISGPQNYTVGETVDLVNYRSVVLYSPSLDMIYAFAPLFVRM